jgi:hypothetical protein
MKATAPDRLHRSTSVHKDLILPGRRGGRGAVSWLCIVRGDVSVAGERARVEDSTNAVFGVTVPFNVIMQRYSSYIDARFSQWYDEGCKQKALAPSSEPHLVGYTTAICEVMGASLIISMLSM